MKTLILVVLVLMAIAELSIADVYVRGYYRKDGTYVPGYTRSSPNQNTWDNYGARPNSERGNYWSNPSARDNDNDGIPNYMDHDDNNNGTLDNYERRYKRY